MVSTIPMSQVIEPTFAKMDLRGLVATFQAFQKGLGPFLATRFLLG